MRDEARADVFDYIEHNSKRRHSTIGYLSPMKFERTLTDAARGRQADQWLYAAIAGRPQSKLAAAITIPVTTAARQENSSRSLRILMTIGAPLCSIILPIAHPKTLAKK